MLKRRVYTMNYEKLVRTDETRAKLTNFSNINGHFSVRSIFVSKSLVESFRCEQVRVPRLRRIPASDLCYLYDCKLQTDYIESYTTKKWSYYIYILALRRKAYGPGENWTLLYTTSNEDTNASLPLSGTYFGPTYIFIYNAYLYIHTVII